MAGVGAALTGFMFIERVAVSHMPLVLQTVKDTVWTPVEKKAMFSVELVVGFAALSTVHL